MYLSDSEKECDDKKTGKTGDKNESKSIDANEEEEDPESSLDSEAKEAKAKEKWEKKLYKPTGPDGRGWGDFRQSSDQEKMILKPLDGSGPMMSPEEYIKIILSL